MLKLHKKASISQKIIIFSTCIWLQFVYVSIYICICIFIYFFLLRFCLNIYTSMFLLISRHFNEYLLQYSEAKYHLCFSSFSSSFSCNFNLEWTEFKSKEKKETKRLFGSLIWSSCEVPSVSFPACRLSFSPKPPVAIFSFFSQSYGVI